MPATYTVGQVAEACQVTPETVRTWIRKGKLRALTLPSGRHRIARDEVTRLLERYG
jgi:excisionase family DNA binding protein